MTSCAHSVIVFAPIRGESFCPLDNGQDRAFNSPLGVSLDILNPLLGWASMNRTINDLLSGTPILIQSSPFLLHI